MTTPPVQTLQERVDQLMACRADFEAWARGAGCYPDASLELILGRYQDNELHQRWLGYAAAWQTVRATPPQAAPTPALPGLREFIDAQFALLQSLDWGDKEAALAEFDKRIKAAQK